MTTSGLISGAITANQLLVNAMEDLGVLSSGELPTAEEGATGMQRINWMLKSWAAKGVNLWRQASGKIDIPAGASYGVLTPDIQAVTSARVLLPNNERLLSRWERDDYMSLPNKATPGVPTIFYPETTRSNMRLYVWPVPMVTTSIALDYARTIEDVTDLSQTLDVPQEWAETIWVNLAARLANTFGATRTDPATVQRITQYAAVLERDMLDADRPESVFMGNARSYRRGC